MQTSTGSRPIVNVQIHFNDFLWGCIFANLHVKPLPKQVQAIHTLAKKKKKWERFF